MMGGQNGPNQLQRKVLEQLLDAYEKSKTFQGGNQVKQSFSVQIGKIFPRYQDDAEYDYFCQVNESIFRTTFFNTPFLSRSTATSADAHSSSMDSFT